jgi:hypothetical protein
MGNQEKRPMNTETVLGVVIDICTRSFVIISDEGSEKSIECETPDQFMKVLAVCTNNLTEDQIVYTEIEVLEN